MVTDVLRCGGWHTTYIEDDVTAELLVELLTLQRPDLLLLSASMPSQIPSVRTLIESIRQGSRTRNVKIVVGGRPFVVAPDLAAAVGADGWAPDARTALDVCDNLTTDPEGRAC
jgi:methanogenic corrinoid protein MtbC1